jgi:hypothetical protein
MGSMLQGHNTLVELDTSFFCMNTSTLSHVKSLVCMGALDPRRVRGTIIHVKRDWRS